MESFEFWWGEDGGALVEDQFVGEVEFFKEEGDAFALADLEVVNDEVRGGGRV